MSKRLRFFIQHLSLSLLMALLLLGVVFYFWYPIPLAKAVGVTSIILMLFVIDIIIGPLLGLLVYKEHKKTLKFDLAVIILVQISALIYGVFTLEQGRPVWIVYNVDRFELVRKNEIIQENLEKAEPQFKQVSWLKPQYVMLKTINSAEKRQEDLFTEVFGGVSLAQMPDRYIAFDRNLILKSKKILPIKKLYEYNHDSIVNNVLSKTKKVSGYVPLKGSKIDMTVLLDSEGKPIKIVDLRPWE
ncbi:TfpX/TfpZ family type IV pilin accessory protein [Acinetobacter sp. ASP199]|uniref:TfpX/TfpZ family type IV pilin accessory protein n=1 Tax=unclassified Acinetobacter TaxID=196816 RepID=UPI001F618C04|nr:TfpX/TfpZ family type IV pilin accessory protein [Acinetobacter sp. ASP199]UNT59004.1 type IV pilin accessory protein [Acinetobacter sp. ASP199]